MKDTLRLLRDAQTLLMEATPDLPFDSQMSIDYAHDAINEELRVRRRASEARRKRAFRASHERTDGEREADRTRQARHRSRARDRA